MTTSIPSNRSTSTSSPRRRKATWRTICSVAKVIFSVKWILFSMIVVVASWSYAIIGSRRASEKQELHSGAGTKEDPYVRTALQTIEGGSAVDTKQFERLQTLIKEHVNRKLPTCVASYQKWKYGLT